MHHLHYRGENHGPYLIDQIKSMWASGIITADAVYLNETTDAWEPVTELLRPPQSNAAEKEPATPAPLPAKVDPLAAPPLPAPSESSSRWLSAFWWMVWLGCTFAHAAIHGSNGSTILFGEWIGFSIFYFVFGWIVYTVTGGKGRNSITHKFLCYFISLIVIACWVGLPPKTESNEEGNAAEDRTSGESEAQRQESLAEAAEIYPELRDQTSLLWQTAKRLCDEARDSNHPNHAELSKPTAVRFFADLAAKELAKPVITSAVQLPPAPKIPEIDYQPRASTPLDQKKAPLRPTE